MDPRHEAAAAISLEEGIEDDHQEREERCKHCHSFCPYCDPDRYDRSIIDAICGEPLPPEWT
jgi:hypothetical protein